jgi:hypothetical protein
VAARDHNLDRSQQRSSGRGAGRDRSHSRLQIEASSDLLCRSEQPAVQGSLWQSTSPPHVGPRRRPRRSTRFDWSSCLRAEQSRAPQDALGRSTSPRAALISQENIFLRRGDVEFPSRRRVSAGGRHGRLRRPRLDDRDRDRRGPRPPRSRWSSCSPTGGGNNPVVPDLHQWVLTIAAAAWSL